jgi:hypothetical protein
MVSFNCGAPFKWLATPGIKQDQPAFTGVYLDFAVTASEIFGKYKAGNCLSSDKSDENRFL